jgi:Holliday junction resolvase RusA-like endonuclease
MELIARFTVVGRPAPQGSKSYLGKGCFKEQSPYVKAWRNDVRNAAMAAFGDAQAVTGPVFTSVTFLFARPKVHHIGSNPDKPLKASAPYWHTSAPDRDKLERATNDALTGVIWKDDSQVAGTFSRKIYHTDFSGACISAWTLDNSDCLSQVFFDSEIYHFVLEQSISPESCPQP